MATEDGNSGNGIGLHEATLAISNLLGPDPDNQEEAEALEPEEGEQPEAGEEEAVGSDYDEYDDEADDSNLEEEGTEDEAPTQELPDDLTVKVKVDGEELEVSLAELRNGYSRTADYTRKSTALAEQRKALEAEAESIRGERALYEQLLPKLREQIEQQASQEPDWDALYEDDPIEAARLERHWRKSRDEQARKLEAVKAEEKRLAEAKLAEQRAAMQKALEAERAKIPEVIPEWKDQEVMNREADEMRKWAISQGISQDELNAIQQANVLGILRKAMMYDKGRKNMEQAKNPVKKKNVVVRPGSRGTQSTPGSVDAKRASQRLARTGRISDAAALLDKLI